MSQDHTKILSFFTQSQLDSLPLMDRKHWLKHFTRLGSGSKRRKNNSEKLVFLPKRLTPPPFCGVHRHLLYYHFFDVSPHHSLFFPLPTPTIMQEWAPLSIVLIALFLIAYAPSIQKPPLHVQITLSIRSYVSIYFCMLFSRLATESLLLLERGHKKWPRYNLIPVQNDRVYN